MRLSSLVLLFSVSGSLLTIPAQGGQRVAADKSSTPVLDEQSFPLSGEFDASTTFVNGERVRRESQGHSFSEVDSSVHLVLTPRISLGYLRLGVEWDRYSFDLSRRSPLPNTLQSLSLVVGLDTKFSDSILVRVEAQPGFYGSSFEHSRGGDINVPFLIGGTYIVSPDFQVIAGVSVNFDRKYPVLPGLGFRWKAAPHLVLNFVLPTPRVEYELTHSSTVYLGAELKDDTFRVDNHFGDSRKASQLNRALVNYSEIRVGAGLTQKITPMLTLTGEVGLQPYREFDFYRADVRYRTDEMGYYGRVALHASF